MVSVKNTSARLIVLFGVNCIPGQVTALPDVENDEQFKATIKGVPGLKVVKTTAAVKSKVETKPEDENAGDENTDDENENTEDEDENPEPNQNSGQWNVQL